MKTETSLAERVSRAAEASLADHRFVCAIDLFQGLGWLPHTLLMNWRRGLVPSLEQVIPCSPRKVFRALAILGDWAAERGLKPIETVYLAPSQESRRELQFSHTGAPEIEALYRTHYVSPELSAAKTDRLREKLEKAPDLVVFSVVRDSCCAECGGELAGHSFLFMDKDKPLCLACADLDHLLYLRRGDAALTRRARKHSTLSAVVVRWSRARKRYERQGLLVEEAALEKAEQECLSDADLRAARREREAFRRAEQDQKLVARVAAKIAELFPGCPSQEARTIAAHTAERGSGRVGRSAAGRALDESSVTLAVVASIRHNHTDYGLRLMHGQDRASARAQIRDRVEEVVRSWRNPPPAPSR